MLEVLTRRYYRIQTLRELRAITGGRVRFISRVRITRAKSVHLFTTHAAYPQIAEAARAMFHLIEQVPPEHDVVIDFYVSRGRRVNRSGGHAAGSLRGAQPGRLPALDPAHRGGRRGNGCDASISPIGPTSDCYEEEKLYRGIHPMMAKRLHLWRLENFQTRAAAVGGGCLRPPRHRA